ncbi:hypothetical protein BIV59_18220 [Bacillus sp. MUM 13]|nr:hypothetical protein BIV59_18220 [Bacillus sp. MUM 13]
MVFNPIDNNESIGGGYVIPANSTEAVISAKAKTAFQKNLYLNLRGRVFYNWVASAAFFLWNKRGRQDRLRIIKDFSSIGPD